MQVRNKGKKVIGGLRQAVVGLLVGANIMNIVMMFLSACSVFVNPAAFPALSCFGFAFTLFQIINLLFFVFWLVFSYKKALIPVVGYLVCLPASYVNCPVNFGSEPPQGALKILTYNVMGFDQQDGKYSDDNPCPIFDYILHSDADIVCLQEAYYCNEDDSTKINKIFAGTYPYHHWEFTGVKDSAGIQMILSKYPILSFEHVEYASVSNGSVAYRILVEKDTFVVINNHLESNKYDTEEKAAYKEMIKNPEKKTFKTGYAKLYDKLVKSAAKRGPEADSLSNYVSRLKENKVIVCGDFNSPPISYVRRRVASELIDAFTQSGSGLGISYNRNGFYFRIDNIMVSKKLRSYGCVVDDGIGTSDHYPMYCWVAYEKQ